MLGNIRFDSGVIALAIILIISSLARANGMQPPALSLDFEAHSARTYMSLEREFVKRHLFDNAYGGTHFSVGGKGNVIDDSKNILFQANVILFLAGMSSNQSPDPEVSPYVNSAAGFIAKHLK